MHNYVHPLRRFDLILSFIALTCFLGPPDTRGQYVEEEDIERTTKSTGERGSESQTIAWPKTSDGIVSSTNQFRSGQGLQPVEVNPKLTQAAQYFAEFMARTNKYGHTADGQRPADRATEHGYEYCIVLENIAYLYSSRDLADQELTRRFVEGWKESPGHRKNMLDADITETGVAVAQSEETNYIYAVQMFGRPKSASIGFEVLNRSGADIEYTIGERRFSLPPRYTQTHQRCRPNDLTFQWPDSTRQDPRTVRPTDGDRFVIVQQAGEFQVRSAEE